MFFRLRKKDAGMQFLTILGCTLKLTFGSFFKKSMFFCRRVFSSIFWCFWGGLRRRRGGPSSSEDSAEFGDNFITPCSPKGVRRISKGFAPAARPWNSMNRCLDGPRLDFWRICNRFGSPAVILEAFRSLLGALAVILDAFGSPKLKPLIFLWFFYDWECPRSLSRAKVEGKMLVSGAQ